MIKLNVSIKYNEILLHTWSSKKYDCSALCIVRKKEWGTGSPLTAEHIF